MSRGAETVVIERGGLGFKISDEAGEYAQATTPEAALRYAADLLRGVESFEERVPAGKAAAMLGLLRGD